MNAIDQRFLVRRVAVLGSGVMGAQIAAHLTNAGVDTVLFDLPTQPGTQPGTQSGTQTPPPSSRAIAERAIAGLRKLSPAPLGLAELADAIQPADYDHDLALLGECDLIIEAIAERLDWKHDLYRRIAPMVAPHAVLASNTSGLSIGSLAEALPDDLKARFCGVHFFNPPRYMHLAELIPIAQTRADVLDRLEGFLTTTLGKGVVRTKDTPNFIANRIGVFGMVAVMIEAERHGLTMDVVDDLTGARLGRAKSGTYRTADVVGLDTLSHVIRTMTINSRMILSMRCMRSPPCCKRSLPRERSARKVTPVFIAAKAKRSCGSILKKHLPWQLPQARVGHRLTEPSGRLLMCLLGPKPTRRWPAF